VGVGNLAPDLALENLAGETVCLADHRGQPVLINFWAVWCTYCREELSVMETVYQSYKDEGFVILAVDVQDAPLDVRDYARELGLTFPILLDRRAEVTRSYRVRGLPTSYFVDKNGVIIARQLGPIDEAWMLRYLEDTGVE
jgi:peroxiredoxin